MRRRKASALARPIMASWIALASSSTDAFTNNLDSVETSYMTPHAEDMIIRPEISNPIYSLNTTPESVTLFDQEKSETQSRDEILSDILHDNEFRALLLGALAVSSIATYHSHLQGKKYDEKRLYALHVGGPLLTTSSIAALAVDSFHQIDRHVPAGLFLGATLIQAGFVVLNEFEHHRNLKYRATSIALGTSLVALGTTVACVTNRMNFNLPQ